MPVFQAEGLTVKTDKQRYTPLFFSKEDLDAAVGNAYTHKEQHREATNKAHSDRANADLAAAQSKVWASGQLKTKAHELELPPSLFDFGFFISFTTLRRGAGRFDRRAQPEGVVAKAAEEPIAAIVVQYDSADGDGKEQAKEGLDKARAKSDKYKGRVTEPNKPEPPKVEVSGAFPSSLASYLRGKMACQRRASQSCPGFSVPSSEYSALRTCQLWDDSANERGTGGVPGGGAGEDGRSGREGGVGECHVSARRRNPRKGEGLRLNPRSFPGRDQTDDLRRFVR